MSFQSLLNQSITIKSVAYTVDSMGGQQTATWTAIHSNIKCRFNPILGRDMVYLDDKKTVWASHYVFLKYLSDIKEGDRVYLGTRVFEIKMIVDWDENNDKMKLAVVEIPNA